jgi:hypothetical protein
MIGSNKIRENLIHVDDEPEHSLGSLIDLTNILEVREEIQGEEPKSSLLGVIHDVSCCQGLELRIYLEIDSGEHLEQIQLLRYLVNNSNKYYKLCNHFMGNRFFVNARFVSFDAQDDIIIVSVEFEDWALRVHPSEYKINLTEDYKPSNKLEEYVEATSHPFELLAHMSIHYWDEIRKPNLKLVH